MGSAAALADDAATVQNLKSFCQNLNQAGSDQYDKIYLRCDAVQDNPDIAQMVVRDQIDDICQSVHEQCDIASSDARKTLLRSYLTTLSCDSGKYTCASAAPTQSGACDKGDINVVVETIGKIQKAGGAVSKALRRAVKSYVEACASNHAADAALSDVNAELVAFYGNRHIGCDEAKDKGLAKKCAAKIDGLWKSKSIQAMFDWANSNSIVSQVTLETVKRWTGTD